MRIRYVAYYRVSTAEQGRSGLGLDAQRRAVADFLHGDAALIAEFEEVESGKSADRPALRAAMNRCRITGSKLLIAKLDRLSRNVHFLTGLEEQGVDFVACDMPGANRFTIHIMAAVAQQEREAISARTKAGLATIKCRLAADGEYVSRRSGRTISRLGNPRGLDSMRPDLGLAAVKARAAQFADLVTPTISGLRSKGMSYAQIAVELDRMGVRTSRGFDWTPSAVKRIADKAALGVVRP